MWTRRQIVEGAALLPAAALVPAPAGGVLTPEMFGARGDGRTDDSAALARLSDAINARGGGTVRLRRTTYLVGTVGEDGEPRRLLEFVNCRTALVVEGQGARLRCAPGQRYGKYRADGSPVPGRATVAPGVIRRPYFNMVSATGCSGSVSISDLELDGNSGALAVGGQHGDTGWQIGCGGLALRENSGPELVRNVHAHHQAQDGFYIDGVDRATPGMRRLLTGLKADANGRQGMSIVGGRGYEIRNSSFTRTARGPIASAPAAGVDIEAERGKRIRDLRFANCTFADNRGCGLVADSGDSADLTFTACTFIGTDNWSCWPHKPRMRFASCRFIGTLVQTFGSTTAADATRFADCLFLDDPALSPTRRIHLVHNLCADLSHAANVLFDRCRFPLAHAGVLPWSVGAVFQDCTMSQVASQQAQTRGTFRGTNRITGNVDIAGSAVAGPLYLNGKLVPPQPGAPQARAPG